jgi:hypothetical protein
MLSALSTEAAVAKGGAQRSPTRSAEQAGTAVELLAPALQCPMAAVRVLASRAMELLCPLEWVPAPRGVKSTVQRVGPCTVRGGDSRVMVCFVADHAGRACCQPLQVLAEVREIVALCAGAQLAQEKEIIRMLRHVELDIASQCLPRAYLSVMFHFGIGTAHPRLPPRVALTRCRTQAFCTPSSPWCGLVPTAFWAAWPPRTPSQPGRCSRRR